MSTNGGLSAALMSPANTTFLRWLEEKRISAGLRSVRVAVEAGAHGRVASDMIDAQKQGIRKRDAANELPTTSRICDCDTDTTRDGDEFTRGNANHRFKHGRKGFNESDAVVAADVPNIGCKRPCGLLGWLALKRLRAHEAVLGDMESFASGQTQAVTGTGGLSIDHQEQRDSGHGALASFILRRATRDDFAHAVKHSTHFWSNRNDRYSHREFSQLPNLLVVESAASAGLLCGYVSWDISQDDSSTQTCAELVTLAVRNEFRRQRLGTRLLRIACQKALASGASVMCLHVRLDNTSARSLYRAFGFSEVSLDPAYYQGNAGLSMELRLHRSTDLQPSNMFATSDQQCLCHDARKTQAQSSQGCLCLVDSKLQCPEYAVSSGVVEGVRVSAADGITFKLLSQAVANVAPIVQRRKWKLQEVKEMSAQKGRGRGGVVLGMHVGAGHIEINMRDRHSASGLVSDDELMSTLLHELAHFEHDSHDQAFYCLLRDLVEEHCRYDLKRADDMCWRILLADLLHYPKRYSALSGCLLPRESKHEDGN